MGTKGSANRQRIVDAADHLFYSRGYNQTSFSDIADETGIPRGNFYYYFKTKEDILAAVVDARLVSFTDILSSCEEATSDPLERLHALAEFPLKHEEEVLRYGCPIGTLSSELTKEQSTEISPARLTAVFDLLRVWIEAQLSETGHASRAGEIAMDMLAKMQGIIMLANIYQDAVFLHRGIKDMHNWLNNTLAN
ncbi:MAG TPA: TetR/AcrR family transcriptional regulator [Gammaproteobacteria bacterium]|nr:TetR/AcrR family transcriptional regulator [Gammaproteobacteria bacterium]